MKIALRALAWLFILLVFVVALAAMGVKFLFPSEKVQAFIIREAQSSLHRQVRIGELSLDIFRGLRMTDVEISERPDFEHGTFATSKRVFFRPQLLPLLSKKVYIDVIALRSAKVTMIREKDGGFNFSDLKNPSTEKSPRSSAYAFLISRISIKDGQIDVIDRSTATMSMQIKNIELTVQHPDLVGPVAVTSSFLVSSKGVNASVDTDSTVDLRAGSARLGAVSIKSGSSQLQIFGEVTGLKQPDPTLALKWRLTAFDPQTLQPLNILPASWKFTGKLNADGSVDGDAKAGHGTLSIDGKNLDARYGTATFHKPAGTAFSAQATAAYRLPLALTFDRLDIHVSETVLSGTGTYTSRGYAFHFGSNTFPLETLTPVFPSFQGIVLSGPGTFSFSLKSGATGAQLQGVAAVHDAAATIKDVALAGVQSNFSFTTNDVAGTLSATKVKHEYFTGENLTVGWSLLDVGDVARMNGTASAKMGPGEVMAVEKLTNKNPIAKILLLPFSILKKVVSVAKSAVRLPTLEGSAYRSLEGDYAFRNGTMIVNKFDLIATSLKASLKGNIGLTGSQPLDANAQISLSESLVRGALGKILNSGLGVVTVSMSIKGTVDKPDVDIDVFDTGKSILKAVGNAAAEPIKQLDKLFKSLFKK